MKKLLAIILSLMLLGSIALAETPLYDYLTDLFLKVYTNSEFESMTGSAVFSTTPPITICSYMPMGETNVIVWHDGNEGYICMDLEKLLLDSESSMSKVYADICAEYDFNMFLMAVDGQRVAYGADGMIEKYTDATGITPDVICDSKEEYINRIPK